MHHSSEMDPQMTERLKEMFGEETIEDVAAGKIEKLGATGRFPEGKLTDQDEGEIMFRIGHLNGKVVLDFGQQVAWVGMSPDQAKDLARMLMKHTNLVMR